MFDKVKNFINGLNESHFSVAVLAAAVGVSYVAGVTDNGITQVLGNKISAAATYLLGATGLTALYGTLNFDVKKEVLTEQNVALGVLLAGLYLGLGFAIGG